MEQSLFTPDQNTKKVNKGNYIFKEGNIANIVYQIKQGHVSLICTNDYDNTLIESIKSVGDYIGYSEVISDKNHSQSALCSEKVGITIRPLTPAPKSYLRPLYLSTNLGIWIFYAIGIGLLIAALYFLVVFNDLIANKNKKENKEI